MLSFPSDPEKPWLYTDEKTVIDTLQPFKADLLVSACYGQKIPWDAIRQSRFGGLNVHPSLLPRWRGADPVPWAILSGDRQTGVTVVTLSDKFDEGAIIAQKKVPITDTDTSDSLRTNLFTLGAKLLVRVTPDFISQKQITKNKFTNNESSYARRLTRDDGFEPWEAIQKALEDVQEARRIDRKFRAFTPWPGLWTKVGEKRLKILRITHNTSRITLHTVQLEGKKPVSWEQFASGYHLFPT